MKRPLLIISLLTLFISGVSAQKLIVQDTLGNDVSGTTIEFNVLKDADFASKELYVLNNTTAAMNVLVRKEEVSMLENTSVYFCWGSCYSPATFISPSPLTIQGGELNKDFLGDIQYPDGITGTTTIKYVFYDQASSRDSAYVIVNYNIGTVGLKENMPKLAVVSNAYPNPAKSSVYFDYNIPSSITNAKIKISNLLGTTVKSIDLKNNEGKATIDVSNLENGVYFYSLMINNSSSVTRKFIVNR